MGCIRNHPLYPQIVHYLRGQPFLVVFETLVDVLECTRSIPQCTAKTSVQLIYTQRLENPHNNPAHSKPCAHMKPNTTLQHETRLVFKCIWGVCTDARTHTHAHTHMHMLVCVWTIIQLLNVTVANSNLIHVLSALLGVYGFLFLCNLDGKCMLFIVRVTYQKLLKVSK